MLIDRDSSSWDNGWHVIFEAIYPGIEQRGATVWLQLAAIFCLDCLMDVHWKYETSEYFKLRKQALKGI